MIGQGYHTKAILLLPLCDLVFPTVFCVRQRRSRAGGFNVHPPIVVPHTREHMIGYSHAGDTDSELPDQQDEKHGELDTVANSSIDHSIKIESVNVCTIDFQFSEELHNSIKWGDLRESSVHPSKFSGQRQELREVKSTASMFLCTADTEDS